MQKERLAFFEKLMAAWCPSGFEEEGQAVVRGRLEGHCDELRTDVHGNVMGGLNTKAGLRVMLAGHVDEIGLMVSHIDDNGFIFFQPIGGVDTNVIAGQRVIVHGRGGPVQGLIGRKAIHLLTEEERKAAPKVEDMFIDIGAASRKEARKVTRVSDPITIDVEMKFLANDIVCSRAFDDRIGAFVAVEVMLEVAKRSPKVALWSVSTVQEEIGLRGAHTSAFGIEPHVGIAIDVGHATDYPGIEKERKRLSDVKLGKGPILCRGANINPIVGQGIEDVAIAKKIDYQFQAEPRGTGTDANAMQLSRSGVATALVSVPNRYMHTPVEVVSLKDLDSTIKLLTEYVMSLKPSDTFIPGLSNRGRKS